jgi:ribosome-associated protein
VEEIKKIKKSVTKKEPKVKVVKEIKEAKVKKVRDSSVKLIKDSVIKTKESKVKKEKKLVFKGSSEAAKFVAKIADESKADYVKILNVGPRLAITDYFVIIGASNTRLTRHIAEVIQANLKKYNIYAMHVEGAAEGNWILIDFDDFVVHIFTDEYRQYYDIERLWRDSKVIRLKATDTETNENIGTKEYPDEQSLFSDDGIRMEIKDI